MTATMKLESGQLLALGSIFTQGVECGTQVLHTLSAPSLTLLSSGEPEFGYGELPPSIHPEGELLCQVYMPFHGPISGEAVFSLPRQTAGQLLNKLIARKADAKPLDTLAAGAFSEVGNIILDSVMGAMGSELGFDLIYQVPGFCQDVLTSQEHPRCTEPWVVFRTQVDLDVKNWGCTGSVLLFLEEKSLLNFLNRVDKIFRSGGRR